VLQAPYPARPGLPERRETPGQPGAQVRFPGRPGHKATLGLLARPDPLGVLPRFLDPRGVPALPELRLPGRPALRGQPALLDLDQILRLLMKGLS
jgi:hypothetical protein